MTDNYHGNDNPADFIEKDYMAEGVTAEMLLLRLDAALDTIHTESLAAEFCRQRLREMLPLA
ncbi:MAG TPA: hypothetical protein PKD55_06020 [Bellilinea sp.]|nr:hypothetical protein [Bellilinea sp.]